MVKRVFGRVDGQEVELYADSGDRFSIPVPFDVDGEYVVEILAEDEAGNQAYRCVHHLCQKRRRKNMYLDLRLLNIVLPLPVLYLLCKDCFLY